MNGIWFWKQGDYKAHVALVNDLYRYQVHSLWQDRFGELVPGPLVRGPLSEPTLADAKRQVFAYLEVQS